MFTRNNDIVDGDICRTVAEVARQAERAIPQKLFPAAYATPLHLGEEERRPAIAALAHAVDVENHPLRRAAANAQHGELSTTKRLSRAEDARARSDQRAGNKRVDLDASPVEIHAGTDGRLVAGRLGVGILADEQLGEGRHDVGTGQRMMERRQWRAR